MAEESQFVRSLRDRLCSDSRVYCTVLEKVLGHRAFASAAENIREVFETELQFALKELLRIKTTLNAGLELRPTLEANMHVFKENVKLAAVALVERISAGATSAESVERSIAALRRAEPHIDSIAEVEEENFSDTLSRTFNLEKAFSLAEAEPPGPACEARGLFPLRGGDALHRTLHEVREPPVVEGGAGARTKSAFRKQAQPRRKSPGSVEKADYHCRSSEAQGRLRQPGKEQPPAPPRPVQPPRPVDELAVQHRYKAQGLGLKKKTLRSDAADSALLWEQEVRTAQRPPRDAGPTDSGSFLRERKTETRLSPARCREKKFSTEKALRTFER